MRLPSVSARARPSNVCSLPKGHLQSTSNGLSQFQSLYLTLQLSTPRRCDVVVVAGDDVFVAFHSKDYSNK